MKNILFRINNLWKWCHSDASIRVAAIMEIRENHGKIRELDNSRKIMENLGNFVKLFPNQGNLHFCLFNIVKKLPNRWYEKMNQEEKEIKQNLKNKKKDWNSVKKVRRK